MNNHSGTPDRIAISFNGVSLFHRNLIFALRTFRKHGGTYVFGICVLALAAGLSTAIFSLVEAVLLRPLPFPHQDSLRVIWKADRKAGVPFIELGYPELHDLQQNVDAFASVAVMPTTLYGYGQTIQFTAQAGVKEPVQVESAPVSHDFFRTLDVSPTLGRDFADSDEKIGAAPVVILSDTVWREHFDSNPTIIGQQIRLNGNAYTVIGVMAQGIDFPRGVGLWTPLGVGPFIQSRGTTYMQAIARVRPGYSDPQVEAQVDSVFTRIAREHPEVYTAQQEGVITSLPDYITGSARLQLFVALGSSLLLLLAGCVTASNLFLSRTIGRGTEIATRAAVGASAAQILGQFLAEGALAGVLAATSGLAIAWGLIRLLIYFAPSGIPRIDAASINRPVLLFAGAVACIVALACTFAPSLTAARFSMRSRLTARRPGLRLQNAFTVVQTAATVVLLVACLLIVVSVRAMLRTDIGFHNRETITMNLALRGIAAGEKKVFYTRLLDRLRESPLVGDAAAVLVRPLEGTIGWDTHYQTEFEATSASKESSTSNFEAITPGYFQTVGTPLLAGRDFSKEEAEPVAIVSHSFAERIRKLGHDPVGTRIRLGRGGPPQWLRIVGVAADTRYRGVTATGDDIYIHYLQTGVPVNYLAIRRRNAGTQRDLIDLVRKEVAQLDSGQAVANIATIAQLVDRDTARQRFSMTLLIVFGLGALLLAGAGVYSVVSESVSVRKREIAIRTALGANRRNLLRAVIGRTIQVVLLGEIAGLLGAVAFGRGMSDLLYEVRSTDPVILGAALLFLLAVSVLAALVPARQAIRQQPRSVLQQA
jgi:putative ABC transport system permease protein